MKIAAFSSGCEQLTRRNVVGPNTDRGWAYFNSLDYSGIAEYNADVLWTGGVFAGDYDSWNRYKSIWGNHKRIVLHWVGSDTLICKKFWDVGQRTMFKDFHSDRFLHIPSSQGLKDELKEWFGIESTEPLDIPAEKVFEELPKPEQYTVGFYLPPDRADFYNYEVMEKLTTQFPERDYRVIFYHWLPLFHDLKLAGPWTKMFALTREQYENDVIAKCSCIVRIPKHDAVSISAGEFLMAGRPFISHHDIPLWPARLKEITPEAINDAIIASMNTKVTQKVQKYYRDVYDPRKYHDRVMVRCQAQWPELMVDVPEEVEVQELVNV